MEFLKNARLFSFLMDGQDAFSYPHTVTVSEAVNSLTTEYYFANGLKVTNIAKKYDDFGAYEWVNWWENTADVPTPILSEIWDCDATVPFLHEDERPWQAFLPSRKTSTKVYVAKGSDYTKDEFYCDIENIKDYHREGYIFPVHKKYPPAYCGKMEFSNYGGRSSAGRAPFVKVHKEDCGCIFAIGWTGQWKARLTRYEDSIHFQSKVEDTHFSLLPNERIRTSSVLVLPYRGTAEDGQNCLRRLIKRHFAPIGQGERPTQAPFCTGIWGGMRSEDALARIDFVAKNNLPFEYIWMDAGWYGEAPPTADEFVADEVSWSQFTGDWRVNRLTHPGGLLDVSKAIHAAGKKFVFWIEPERAIEGVAMTKAHPDWYLDNGDPQNRARLLDLGNPEAWQYCYDTLSELISTLSVDCYRQDFNIPPLPYWRKNDTPDRQGITEIKHVMGLYRLWDTLLATYPRLLIDNCSSGGNRIDMEMMRRSVVLWRSDLQCPADFDVEHTQFHSATYGAWSPYTGAGAGRDVDEYRLRSSYGPSMTTNFFFSGNTVLSEKEKDCEKIRKYADEYLRLRPYFSEDLYVLTEPSTSFDVWCALQYDRPEQRDGIVQVFRREDAPYERATFHLHGIDPAATYEVEDLDGGTQRISGKTLSEEGFSVQIAERPKAKIYCYRKV